MIGYSISDGNASYQATWTNKQAMLHSVLPPLLCWLISVLNTFDTFYVCHHWLVDYALTLTSVVWKAHTEIWIQIRDFICTRIYKSMGS